MSRDMLAKTVSIFCDIHLGLLHVFYVVMYCSPHRRYTSAAKETTLPFVLYSHRKAKPIKYKHDIKCTYHSLE